jgi:hypothetical protein
LPRRVNRKILLAIDFANMPLRWRRRLNPINHYPLPSRAKSRSNAGHTRWLRLII